MTLTKSVEASSSRTAPSADFPPLTVLLAPLFPFSSALPLALLRSSSRCGSVASAVPRGAPQGWLGAGAAELPRSEEFQGFPGKTPLRSRGHPRPSGRPALRSLGVCGGSAPGHLGRAWPRGSPAVRGSRPRGPAFKAILGGSPP